MSNQNHEPIVEATPKTNNRPADESQLSLKGEAPQDPKAPISIKKEIISWVLHFAVALLLVIIIQAFIFIPVRVEGSSMADTLHNQDYLFTTKFDYILGEPQRQDVVICHYPGRTREALWGLVTLPENFVKRIIAIPGDTIEIQYDSAQRQNVVLINGQPLSEPYLTPANNQERYPMAPITLGEDQYFMIGDNRDDSNDSRNLASVGPIERKDIVSHVRFVFFPFNQWRGVQ